MRVKKKSYFFNSFKHIIEKCPKLERIHLECIELESAFFTHLAECFPAATNLRAPCGAFALIYILLL